MEGLLTAAKHEGKLQFKLKYLTIASMVKETQEEVEIKTKGITPLRTVHITFNISKTLCFLFLKCKWQQYSMIAV